jgi:hypothetical protein
MAGKKIFLALGIHCCPVIPKNAFDTMFTVTIIIYNE